MYIANNQSRWCMIIVVWCCIRSTLPYKNIRFTSLYCIYHRYPNQSISIYSIHWNETQKNIQLQSKHFPLILQIYKKPRNKTNETITARQTTSPQQSTSRGMRYNSIVVVHHVKPYLRDIGFGMGVYMTSQPPPGDAITSQTISTLLSSPTTKRNQIIREGWGERSKTHPSWRCTHHQAKPSWERSHRRGILPSQKILVFINWLEEERVLTLADTGVLGRHFLDWADLSVSLELSSSRVEL